jgi:hypothetical protein
LINLAKTLAATHWSWCLGWLFVGIFALPSSARAQAGAVEPPILLGGAAAKAGSKEPPLDPLLPTGARRSSTVERPRQEELPACSPRRPVCVHRGDALADRALLALTVLEQAYERLVLALRLPPPLPDFGRGGSDALDVYLEHSAAVEPRVGFEEIAGEFDRAAAFCVVADLSGVLLERVATQCVAEAIALRLDASETPDSRRGYATHLWLSVGAPTAIDLAGIDLAQSTPQVATATRELTESSALLALFLEYLESKRSTAGPGQLATGLFALAASRTGAAQMSWNNEPDVFDVLRHSIGNNRVAFGQLLGSFAVARGFLGDRDDGTHWPRMEWPGAFGRVRFDWSIPFSTLPRRVASVHPVEPTGAFYLWLDLDHVPSGAALGVQAEWEAPVPFKWEIVRVGRDGRELSRIDVPYQETGTSFEQRVVDLEAAAGLIIAGINVGDTEINYPFDPDIAPFEGQRCTVYLARL